mmetsp:Transcript_94824/g.294917  ORF Transcript_94824/g.294917 Transcript_94824/m.294917 type:complete len:316 (-) Transcript_94824:11-958(-)
MWRAWRASSPPRQGLLLRAPRRAAALVALPLAEVAAVAQGPVLAALLLPHILAGARAMGGVADGALAHLPGHARDRGALRRRRGGELGRGHEAVGHGQARHGGGVAIAGAGVQASAPRHLALRGVHVPGEPRGQQHRRGLPLGRGRRHGHALQGRRRQAARPWVAAVRRGRADADRAVRAARALPRPRRRHVAAGRAGPVLLLPCAREVVQAIILLGGRPVETGRGRWRAGVAPPGRGRGLGRGVLRGEAELDGGCWQARCVARRRGVWRAPAALKERQPALLLLEDDLQRHCGGQQVGDRRRSPSVSTSGRSLS